MRHPFRIYTVTMILVIGCLLCPWPAFAYPDYSTGTTEATDASETTEEASYNAGYGSVDTSWFDYLDPKPEYTISTEAELRGLASLVNEEQFLWKPNRTESFEGVTFVLTRDITLTDAWTPIGIDNQITFSGTFDGKGHTINDLDLNYSDPNAGFFGHLSGTVRNLRINGTVDSTSDDCGSIAGSVGTDGIIKSCECNVQVAGRNEVGGVAGYSHGTVIDCMNFGEVIGRSMVGGIVGESRGGTIKRCGNRGLIVSNGAGSFNNGTGGIAGRSVSASTISSCFNAGDIISSNETTGGVTGYTNSAGSSIIDSYSIGTIRIDEAQVQTVDTKLDLSGTPVNGKLEMTGPDLPVYAGGIAGFVGSENLAIENCYNAGSITGADYTGGIIGKCENEVYSSEPPAFRNNYYGKGSYDGAIAADRNDKKMKVRGSASEIYESAFGHLADSLGNAYRDDRSGDYGSKGYPVLTWQPKYSVEDSLAVLKHIDPATRQWLHDANLAMETKGFRHGRRLLALFSMEPELPTAAEKEVLKEKGILK